MLTYHRYPHNPFSFSNYECTDSWSTSFLVHMTCSLPSCVHYIYIYMYKNLSLHMAWCYTSDLTHQLAEGTAFLHKYHRWWTMWFQGPQVIRHCHSHTQIHHSQEQFQGGRGRFQQCFEQWKCQLIKCIAGQGNNFKGTRNSKCVCREFKTVFKWAFQHWYIPCYHKAWKLYIFPSWDVILINYSSLEVMQCIKNPSEFRNLNEFLLPCSLALLSN